MNMMVSKLAKIDQFKIRAVATMLLATVLSTPNTYAHELPDDSSEIVMGISNDGVLLTANRKSRDGIRIFQVGAPLAGSNVALATLTFKAISTGLSSLV